MLSSVQKNRGKLPTWVVLLMMVFQGSLATGETGSGDGSSPEGQLAETSTSIPEGRSTEIAEENSTLEPNESGRTQLTIEEKKALKNVIRQINRFPGDGPLGIFGEPAKFSTYSFVTQFKTLMRNLLPENKVLPVTLDHLASNLSNRRSRLYAVEAVAKEIDRIPTGKSLSPQYGAVLGFLEGTAEIRHNKPYDLRKGLVKRIANGNLKLVGAFFGRTQAERIQAYIYDLKKGPAYFREGLVEAIFSFNFRKDMTIKEYRHYAQRIVKVAEMMANQQTEDKLTKKEKNALKKAIDQISKFPTDGNLGFFGQPTNPTTTRYINNFKSLVEKILPNNKTIANSLNYLLQNLSRRKSRNHALQAVKSDIDRIPTTNNASYYSQSHYDSVAEFLNSLKEMPHNASRSGLRLATARAVITGASAVVEGFLPPKTVKALRPYLVEYRKIPGHAAHDFFDTIFYFDFRRIVKPEEVKSYGKRVSLKLAELAKTCQFAKIGGGK